MGTGKRLECVVHQGAGAYICGEETALMNSLEGRRGNPAHQAAVPRGGGPVRHADDDQQRRDARRGAAHPEQRRRVVQRRSASTTRRAPAPSCSRSAATCASGQLRGRARLPDARVPVRPLRRAAAGRELKAVIPGGSSVPILTPEEVDGCVMDYEGFVAAGSMLGSGGVIVFDDTRTWCTRSRGCALLRARELCAVHAVPRGHGVDDADPRAHPARRGQGMDLDARCSISPTT